MDITSIDISRALLERLRDFGEDGAERLFDGVRLEVRERAVAGPASAAGDDGLVGRIVLNTEDGTATILTVEFDAD
ncbi:hypothetical protein HKCCE3408_16010 [Rhodobacterales bacterium HKCCE3408]|nr:hypothetical protein [Rhodobacterales bacterium HKCCE3408]